MKEALLYQKLAGETIRCQNCAHYCTILPGNRGICGVRENRNGKLYSLVYGKVDACQIDPIEKKPFFHFLPGTYSLSIATVGCNFACQNCQNWQISQAPKLNGEIEGEDLSPEDLVNQAKENHLPSISYTYTEPTIFLEYALETMELAKREGLKNNWVTNGFMSKEAFKAIAPFLDAANVDLKGFSEEFYRENCNGRLEPVLETLKRMRAEKIWVEVTTLIIPTLNDTEEILKKIAGFIKDKLGAETPWHVIRFSGAISWKLQHLPDTPIETLEKAYEIGKEAGLKYIYTGNVSGLDSEDTFCPKCGAKMVGRAGYRIERYDKDGRCAKCGQDLNIVM